MDQPYMANILYDCIVAKIAMLRGVFLYFPHPRSNLFYLYFVIALQKKGGNFNWGYHGRWYSDTPKNCFIHNKRLIIRVLIILWTLKVKCLIKSAFYKNNSKPPINPKKLHDTHTTIWGWALQIYSCKKWALKITWTIQGKTDSVLEDAIWLH